MTQTQKIVSGNDIIYSLVRINPADTEFLKESNTKHHQFVGFVWYDSVEDKYSFYSVEDKYKNPIVNHWTTNIVSEYHNETCFLVIKENPCKLYSVITDIYKRNICNVGSFDIWKSDEKNCLVAVVTNIDVD